MLQYLEKGLTSQIVYLYLFDLICYFYFAHFGSWDIIMPFQYFQALKCASIE